jgi:hypothetical protein
MTKNNSEFNSFMKNTGWSQVGGGLGDLFMQNPYDVYSDKMGGIPSQLQQYLQKALGYMSPYQKTGTNAMSDYFNMLRHGEDSQGMVNNIMGGYSESPSATFQRKQGLADISTGAAARGLLGSGSQARSMMNYGQDLTNQDMQQYLNNILGVRNSTMSGLGQLSRMGEQAAGQMGDWNMQTGDDIANIMAKIAEAQANSQQDSENDFGSIMSGLGKGIMSLF